MESSSWTNKTHANQANYATLIYFCWKHIELLITGELQLEKNPPRRQLLTFDSSCLQWSSPETRLCHTSCPSPGTSSPWECHPCWECHPRCCDIPSAGRWAWHHFVSPALRLWVLNWRSAALSSGKKWRTLSLLWITTEWKFIYQYQQSIRATDTNSLLT